MKTPLNKTFTVRNSPGLRKEILLALIVFIFWATLLISDQNAYIDEIWRKITFDITRLDPDGLYGPPDGKRARSYEFCIPDTRRIKPR